MEPLMKKLLLFVLLFSASSLSQTIVNSYPFPQYVHYNYLWGVTQKNDTFWVASQYNSTSSEHARIYKVSKSGIIIDSLISPLLDNHGIEWDGTNFWIADEYHSPNSRIYKMTP